MKITRVLFLLLLIPLLAGCGQKQTGTPPTTSKTSKSTPAGTKDDGGAGTGSSTAKPGDSAKQMEDIKESAKKIEAINSDLKELDENESLSVE